MKKVQLMVLVFFLSLAFISCKKTSVSEEINVISQEQSSIQNWLTSQKEKNSSVRINKIEELTKNLLFAELWVEKNGELKFVVVPISESYKFSNNKENKVSNYFVSLMNKNSKILYSVIVQNKPVNIQNGTTIKHGNIANVLNGELVKEDCNVKVITIYDYYLYEKNYKKNSLISTLSLEKKPVANGNPNKNNEVSSLTGCTDWYWVTTYPDGTQTWQFLYTTCGNCGMPNPYEATVICESDNGGGSNNNTPAELELQFNQYTASTSSPVTLTSTSIAGNNPIVGTLPWTVVQGQFASWKVEAIITYGYYHYEFYNSLTNSFEQSYDLFNYSSTGGAYIGSNTFITTTWSGAAVSQVFNNNSANTTGQSIVNGTLNHASNIGIPSPGGSPITLRKSVGAGNGVIFNPK